MGYGRRIPPSFGRKISTDPLEEPDLLRLWLVAVTHVWASRCLREQGILPSEPVWGYLSRLGTGATVMT